MNAMFDIDCIAFYLNKFASITSAHELRDVIFFICLRKLLFVYNRVQACGRKHQQSLTPVSALTGQV